MQKLFYLSTVSHLTCHGHCFALIRDFSIQFNEMKLCEWENGKNEGRTIKIYVYHSLFKCCSPRELGSTASTCCWILFNLILLNLINFFYCCKMICLFYAFLLNYQCQSFKLLQFFPSQDKKAVSRKIKLSTRLFAEFSFLFYVKNFYIYFRFQFPN